jgi:hypothetical protein
MNFFANIGKCFYNILFLGDTVINWEFLVFIKDNHSNVHEGLFGPREEPIDSAAAY